jgi:tRNA U34 2-thiouridine synthase MnmA/TrmU
MQVRYHGELIKAKLTRQSKDEIKILPKSEVLVANGQSILVYLKDKVILAGIVK